MTRDWPLIGLIASIALLFSCAPGSAENSAASDEKPAQVVVVPGSDANHVVLTALAAERLGIKAEPVGAQPGASAPATTIPASALVYDEHGGIWVFMAVEGSPTNEAGLPLTFVRQRVTVSRVDADVAFLKSGPALGTVVVTVGVAELLGAEYGVEGE
jgi:hypothetical protein